MTLCRFHRNLASLWLDDPQRLPALIEKHLRLCPACREQWQREAGIAQSLRTAARAEREPSPPSLPSRVQSRLRSTEALDHCRPTQPLFGYRVDWAGAALAAVLIVSMAYWLWPEPAAKPHTAIAAREVPDPRALVRELMPPGGGSLEQWSQLLEQPLSREINSALEDSRGALIALVQNFVPERNVVAVTERANGLFPEMAAPATAQP